VAIAGDGVAEGDARPDADDGLDDRHASVLVLGHVETETPGPRTDSSEVVGIARAHRELDQLAVGPFDHPELLAPVGGREHPGPGLGESEVHVERTGLVDPGDAERDLGQAVDRHRRRF
jgi:hypothetical protein